MWSKHPYATRYLACVAFAESSFFPIPPDVMLIPMGLALPKKALRYALITTFFSVLGGILGYLLGYFFAPMVQELLQHFDLLGRFLLVKSWFLNYGIWIIFLAGFSPIPYKLFTIAAGVLQMSFLPFVLASFVGRGSRFFLLSLAIYYFGERVNKSLEKYIESLGWLFCMAAAVIYIIYASS
jgi:membrane protein YqaA with SNARE-associated domain